jgi:hypothetical protein
MSTKSNRIKDKIIKQESLLNYNVKMKGRTLDFLNKVESLGGYINYVDGMELVHHYLLHFPPIFELSFFSTEDELILCYYRLKKLLQYNLDHEPEEYYVFDDDKERKKQLYREQAKEYARNRRDIILEERESETPEEKEERLQKNRDYQSERRKALSDEQESLFEKDREEKLEKKRIYARKYREENKEKLNKRRNQLNKELREELEEFKKNE